MLANYVREYYYFDTFFKLLISLSLFSTVNSLVIGIAYYDDVDYTIMNPCLWLIIYGSVGLFYVLILFLRLLWGDLHNIMREFPEFLIYFTMYLTEFIWTIFGFVLLSNTIDNYNVLVSLYINTIYMGILCVGTMIYSLITVCDFSCFRKCCNSMIPL